MDTGNTLFIFTTRYLPSQKSDVNYLFYEEQELRPNECLSYYRFNKGAKKKFREWILHKSENKEAFWGKIHQFFCKYDGGYMNLPINLFQENKSFNEKYRFLLSRFENSAIWKLFGETFGPSLLDYPLYQIENELVFGCPVLEMIKPKLQIEFINRSSS